MTSAPPPALHVRARRLPDDASRDLYVVGGRITFEPVAGAATLADDGWLVPGLVDAHCHIGIGPAGPVDRDEQERQALADRATGALLLRDCGSPVDNSWVQDRPDLPRLIRAGRHLAPHRRYLPNVGIELDPDQLPDAAAEQARSGDGWVKLVGDWIDRTRGDLAPCWPADVLAEAVRRAHEAGARVTAHVFGEEAVPDLLAAGIDCLEHGTGLTADTIAAMAAAGTALVPTLINIDNFPSIADTATKFPTYAAHMRDLHARSRETVHAAYDAGVSIYPGTDAGGGIAHGRLVDELVALRDAGLPPGDVLAAAAWAGRRWLGWPGLEEGAPADFLVLDADPRADLDTLRAPRHVVLAGAVVH